MGKEEKSRNVGEPVMVESFSNKVRNKVYRIKTAASENKGKIAAGFALLGLGGLGAAYFGSRSNCSEAGEEVGDFEEPASE